MSDTLETQQTDQSREMQTIEAMDKYQAIEHLEITKRCKCFVIGAKWADAHPRPEELKKDEMLKQAAHMISLANSFIVEEDIRHYSTAVSLESLAKEWLEKYDELVRMEEDEPR